MANSVWQQLSGELSQAVDDAGKSVVAVDGRQGHTSSGVVWKKNLVLTAAHAVRQEAGILVTVAPGKTVYAKLAGRDSKTDLAVLKLEQDVQPEAARFGETTPLAVGQLVLAVARTRRGNLVASAGILGGLMGEWRTSRGGRIDQFVRPDLTLYPGFSGGPLVAAGGQVLGLNTSGLVRGKPLTIPSSTVTRIAEELAEKGQIPRPYVGLVMQPVPIPESLRTRLGVNVVGGLMVMHVEPGGPADQAGVLIGDILLDLDGAPLDTIDEVQVVLDERKVGHDARASVIRGGEKKEFTIRIGARPSR